MDVVRVLGLLVVYELAYFFLWRTGVWYTHPAVADNGFRDAATVLLLLLISGLPAALLIKLASLHPYFRATSRIPFTWKRALGVVPILFVIAVCEKMLVF
jgi:hypothetical protein